MGLLQTTKYPVKHPLLRLFIKYFWVLKSIQNVNINHKLLPVGNIDFILNLSHPIRYTTYAAAEITPKKFHFNGLRERYCMINQQGRLEVFGISFFPAGLYPFIKVPLAEFTNHTIDLNLLMEQFVHRIEERFGSTESIPQKLCILEEELLKLLDTKLIPATTLSTALNAFNARPDHMNIQHFCDEYGIHQRKLERVFNKYVGVSPKRFHKIIRFQGILNQMVLQENTDLTALTYEYYYYDQTHFFKDFKSFTGCSPTQFLSERRSIKQII